MTNRNYRFIVTGGGTGGHIFPAVAIADALRRRYSSCEILFVGAEGRMEMERVPRAGYPIKAIPVAGLDRRHLLRNFGVLAKLLKAIRLAKRYTLDFQPDLVIGVGVCFCPDCAKCTEAWYSDFATRAKWICGCGK